MNPKYSFIISILCATFWHTTLAAESQPEEESSSRTHSEAEETEQDEFQGSARVHLHSYAFTGQAYTDSGRRNQSALVYRLRPTLEYHAPQGLHLEFAWDLMPLIGDFGPSVFAIRYAERGALRLPFDPGLQVKEEPVQEEVLLLHNLDRLSLTFAHGPFQLALGRQEIGHGSALLFPASDIFFPFLPGTIDTTFKRGVDALSAHIALNAHHKVGTHIIAHEPKSGDSALDPQTWTYLVRLESSFPGLMDVSSFAGLSYEQPTMGLGISSNFGKLDAYAEGSLRVATQATQAGSTAQGTMGARYAWQETFETTAELHYNTIGMLPPFEELREEWPMARQAGEINLLGSVYGGLGIDYGWRSVQFDLKYLQNLQDASSLWTTRLSYQFGQVGSVGIGGVVPIGKRPSEYKPNIPFFPSLTTYTARSEFGSYPTFGFIDVRLVAPP